MSEIPKIKLNLAGLASANKEAKVIPEKQESIVFTLDTNLHPPMQIEKNNQVVAEEWKNITLWDSVFSWKKILWDTIKNEEEKEKKSSGKLSLGDIIWQEELEKKRKEKERNTPEWKAILAEKQKIKAEEDLVKNNALEQGLADEATEKEKKWEIVHFKNYESDFQKKSQTIINRIRKFRYTPKTRLSLILSLVVLTSFSIGLLMIFFPERHSLSIYKASILEIYNQTAKPKSLEVSYENEETNTSLSQDDWGDTKIEEIITNEGNNAPSTEEDIEEQKIKKGELQKERLRNYLVWKYQQ